MDPSWVLLTHSVSWIGTCPGRDSGRWRWKWCARSSRGYVCGLELGWSRFKRNTPSPWRWAISWIIECPTSVVRGLILMSSIQPVLNSHRFSFVLFHPFIVWSMYGTRWHKISRVFCYPVGMEFYKRAFSFLLGMKGSSIIASTVSNGYTFNKNPIFS